MFQLRKKIAHPFIAIRVRPAHKSTSDQPYSDFLFLGHKLMRLGTVPDCVILVSGFIPAVLFSHFDKCSQHVIPRLLLQHDGIGKHTAIPADVLERFGKVP
jgi:hypothetical protein